MIKLSKSIQKKLAIGLLGLCFSLAPLQSQAAVPIAILEIIREGVKKVIVAIDLKIQREQNKVIWLQNAQKVMENTLSKLKLEEIANWSEKQRELYQKYFDELHTVKSVISSYRRVKEISKKQTQIVSEYQKAWAVIQQDKHFTPKEIAYMSQVYTGILAITLENIDQMVLLIKSFTLQMSEGERLSLLQEIADRVDENYRDLIHFNQSNGMLSLQRASNQQEILNVQLLYGINQ